VFLFKVDIISQNLYVVMNNIQDSRKRQSEATRVHGNEYTYDEVYSPNKTGRINDRMTNSVKRKY